MTGPFLHPWSISSPGAEQLGSGGWTRPWGSGAVPSGTNALSCQRLPWAGWARTEPKTLPESPIGQARVAVWHLEWPG